MANTLTVSCVQFTARDDDKESTVKTCLDLIDQAAGQGAQLVVLPEVWTGLGYSTATKYREIAEPVPGPVTDLLANKAREHRLHIVGSLYAQAPAGTYQNLAPLLGPDGEIIGAYVKTHLFDAPDRTDIPLGCGSRTRSAPGTTCPSSALRSARSGFRSARTCGSRRCIGC